MTITTRTLLVFLVGSLFLIQGCEPDTPSAIQQERESFYPSSKPCTRWWWFATEIKKPDVKYQLDWAKENNFGGVEIAWVYPLHRYQNMYATSYNRHYPVDTSAQKMAERRMVGCGGLYQGLCRLHWFGL